MFSRSSLELSGADARTYCTPETLFTVEYRLMQSIQTSAVQPAKISVCCDDMYLCAFAQRIQTRAHLTRAHLKHPHLTRAHLTRAHRLRSISRHVLI